MIRLNRGKIFFGAVCLIYIAAFVPMNLIHRTFLNGAMAWNLFLACVPLVFAAVSRHCARKEHHAAAVVTGAAWLLFFPNAPYMITDLIHLSGFDFYKGGYTHEFILWLLLVYVIIGVLLGSIAGLLSLDIIRTGLFLQRGRRFSWLFVTGVSLTSGYAIFMGRFLRLNSWDILRPLRLVRRMAAELDGFTIAFSMLMAGYILLTYALFCAAKKQIINEGRGSL